jgi:ferredoxin
MQVELQAHIAFHLTGKMPQGEADALAQSDLLPAILAEYRDLTTLRYDFPLVLMGGDPKPVQSLSGLFDNALKDIAAGNDGDRVKKHAVRLEGEIRKLVAEGAAGSLFELCDAAAARMGAKKDQLLEDSLSRLRTALKTDGAVVGCDQAMPFRLFQHAWQALQDQKAQSFRTGINKLIIKLSDILSADFIRSKEGLSAERLRASVGSAHQSTFDFDAMSRVLAESAPSVPMPESRRQRVRGLLTALRTQRFFSPAGEGDKWIGVAEPYSFVFETCADAVAAYRERLPKMTELAKAMAMAKLETEGEYSEARHDAFFAEFGDNGLDPDDIAAFPDYLICLRAADFRAAESDLILRAFAAGMPAKLVVQTDDLVEQSPIRDDYLVAGLRGRQLASTAMGFGASYVLQASSSSLFQLRDQVLRGLAYRGPAIFSIFSGANGSSIPPYLAAAAASESRAFPAFTYDPSAGPDWASRFSLCANSQVDLDWPLQRLDYEDEQQQLVSETLAFTLVDFAACDPRCAKYFARVPRAKWTADLLPVSEFLAREPKDLSDKVPCLLMVDRDNRLQKVIVNDTLIREARRCVEAWRNLQELGGVHNSHAARLVEQERKAWTETEQARAAVVPAQAPAVTPAATPATPARPARPAAPAAPAAASSAAEAAPERSPDEPYIETFRCSSCNECTQINDKMFGYDDNKQAFIKDLNAGTYRQLVEAAENCQLSIIHPGKPWNQNEPGLDELVKRAEPFM